MSQRRGIQTPVATTERVAAAIASFERDTFTVDDVRAKLPDMLRARVRGVLARKTRVGWLERVGRSAYRIGGVRIKTHLPSGLVAEALWAALSTDPGRRFRNLAEFVGDTEAYINRPGVSLYYDVSSLLSYWHRDGYLERIGRRREYRYRLREDVTERPVCKRIR